MSSLPELPSKYTFESLLSARDEERVLLVSRGGERLVMRIDPPPGSGEAYSEVATELDVLASVQHPALIPLADFGRLADGSPFVVRAFVDGAELGTHWASQSDQDSAARVLLELLMALGALHQAGFVHGDLKPSNVIVDRTGHLFLCDFGLAGSRQLGGDQQVGARSRGGSLYYAAPELLLGAAASPASDLFAVGVIAHELLLGERRPAAEFYAEFPRRGFLEAAGTPLERLPEWARSWVQRLLAVDPSERPRCAAEAARELATRAGLPRPPSGPPPCPSWSAIAAIPARLDWLDEVLEGLTTPGEALWLEAPAGEDLAGLALALGLEATKSGFAIDVLDLDSVAQKADTALALDVVFRQFLSDSKRAKLVRFGAGEAWVGRAAGLLLRAWEQLEQSARPTLAVLTDAGTLLADRITWSPRPLPALVASELRALLTDALEAEPAELEALAELLHESGSIADLNARLLQLQSAGVLVPGESRPRLREGAREVLGRAGAIALSTDYDQPTELGRLLLARATVARVGLDRAHLKAKGSAEEAARLLEGGYLLRSGGRLVASDLGRAWVQAELAAENLVDAHRDEYERLRTSLVAGVDSALEPELALQAVAAALPDSARVCAERWEQLRSAGAPERVLAFATRLTGLLQLQGRALPPLLVAERGFAELASGSVLRAEACAAELEAQASGAEPQALCMRLRGRIAELRHLPEEAHAAFTRALELDPSAAGEVAVARANLWFAEGKLDAVLELVTRSTEGHGVSARQRDYLRSVAAMVHLRRGDAARAATELGALLETARGLGDRQREAALAANLATVFRRSGELDRALAANHMAVEAYRAVGHLPGLALAKNQLGGLLRELGELAAAATELSEAADLRGRLGDDSGQAVVRGTLGLLLAERGHVALALEQLLTARKALQGGQAKLFGPLLDARCEELRARLGREASPASELRSLSASKDARVLLALGRAAILRGQGPRAAGLLRRASDAARGHGDRAIAVEAAFLLAHGLSAPRRAARVEGEEAAPIVAEDREVLALVLTDPASLDRTSARALAEDLDRRGRDDRAARLWCALAGAAPESDAKARALAALARCELGADEHETRNLRSALLGFPDPNPHDLERLTGSSDLEEMDMDIVRLLEINHRLVGHEDLSSLLGSIVEEAIEVSGAERGYLILEEHGVLRLDTARNSSRGGLDEPDLEVSGSVVRRCFDEFRCLRISDAAEDPLLGGAQSVRELELRSILCAPFRVDPGLRGVIYLDNRLRHGAFDERAERLVGLLVGQAALAISQVRRREEIERLNGELAERIEAREADLEVARRDLAAAGLPRPVGGLVGRSPVLLEAKALIARAAPTDLSILITGQSGTGKELAARAVHDLSERSAGPFVSENCAAMPPSLIEAELFGVRRGAFTGAEHDRPGLFERAQGGTLFLDEVGEMPLELQAKMLRALETREVRPVGGAESLPVDFRLVTATNRNLAAEVAAERFRGDLYYRIRGLELHMPALEEIPDDVPEFVAHFLDIEGRRLGQAKVMTPPVLERLVARSWPGNVRELRNEVRRLFALSGERIDDAGLVRDPSRPPEGTLDGSLAEIERRAIEQAIQRCGGDKRAAALALGISRAKIYQRLKEWAAETS